MPVAKSDETGHFNFGDNIPFFRWANKAKLYYLNGPQEGFVHEAMRHLGAFNLKGCR